MEDNAHGVTTMLAGSAAPALSIEDIIASSTDPETTRANLNFNNLKLGLGSSAGHHELRERVAERYESGVTADDVVIANGTTGANLLVFQSLLPQNSHCISLYPAYAQLADFPRALNAQVSYWHLDPKADWKISVADLEKLIRPNGETKMLILNNPHNPTGQVLSTGLQQQIVEVAKKHRLIVFCDEIFRPLFHAKEIIDAPPKSMLEHTESGYDRVVVTGSLSKCYGLSGVRIGWVVSRNAELRGKVFKMRQWLLQATATTDEIIGKEVLSSRCRPGMLERTLANAKANIPVLGKLVAESNGRVECTMPQAAGTMFLKVLQKAGGQPVDDLAFCRKVKEEQGLLFAPASRCFYVDGQGDLKGYMRVHITAPPKTFKEGMEKLSKVLQGGD